VRATSAASVGATETIAMIATNRPRRSRERDDRDD